MRLSTFCLWEPENSFACREPDRRYRSPACPPWSVYLLFSDKTIDDPFRFLEEIKHHAPLEPVWPAHARHMHSGNVSEEGDLQSSPGRDPGKWAIQPPSLLHSPLHAPLSRRIWTANVHPSPAFRSTRKGQETKLRASITELRADKSKRKTIVELPQRTLNADPSRSYLFTRLAGVPKILLLAT